MNDTTKLRVGLLLASIAGAVCHSIGLLMFFSNSIRHDAVRGEAVAHLLGGGGGIVMVGSLCLYAYVKGRSWLWGLLPLFPVPLVGFLVSLLILVMMRPKTE